MAGQESGRRSNKKSKGKRKKQQQQQQATTTNPKEKTLNKIQRFDERENGVEKVPSNAPTMAIAPSDYEHIFHEATGIVAQPRTPDTSRPKGTNRTVYKDGQPGTPPPAIGQVSPTANQQANTTRYGKSPADNGNNPGNANNNNNLGGTGGSKGMSEGPLLISPDGYNLLGQAAAYDTPAGQKKIALPPHIVRASNQFSRAALARVAKYLATRAEPTR